VKSEDVPRTDLNKLRPALPPADRDQTAEEARPQPPPGDLVMGKPEAHLRPDTGTAEQSRPRTIQEALARRQNSQLPGRKMKQDGGVSRMRIDPGFDVRATPFGAYDAAFIAAVTQHWYDLLDQQNYALERTGKVVLQFHLNYDGRITDMKVAESTVGDVLGLLCQKAVLDPAPYEKWPREMRLMVEKEYREIQFTFYYN
jgi:outer membrane biosynthesis protein TonB